VFSGLGDTGRYETFAAADSIALGVAVNDTDSVSPESLGRVVRFDVELTAAAAADFTVEVTVDGHSVGEATVATGETRASGEADFLRFSPGAVVAATVTAADAGQTGAATVGVDLEPYRLRRRPRRAQESARERFSRSAARRAYLPPARSTGRVVAAGSLSEKSTQIYDRPSGPDPIPPRFKDVIIGGPGKPPPKGSRPR